MLLVVLFLFSISLSLGGEVKKLEYKPGYGFYLNGAEYGKKVYKESTSKHIFTLTVQQYEYTQYGGGMFSHGVQGYLYTNVIKLRFNRYLLDDLMIPSIDTLEHCELGRSVLSSVKPVMPTDVGEPKVITVYFSMVDGKCRRKYYLLTTSLGKYYEAGRDDYVDLSLCEHSSWQDE